MLAILLALFCSPAFSADAGLDQLKQSFAGLMQTATVEFNRAAQMKPTVLELGAKISKETCERFKSLIRKNYKLDPFDLFTENSTHSNFMCGGRYGYLQNHIQSTSGTTNMGLPFAMVIQLQDDDPFRRGISNYYIDSSYRIVEHQGLSLSVKTGELVEYGITSIDARGNIYLSTYTKNLLWVGKDVEGPNRMEQFISADGMIPFPLTRNTVKDNNDPRKDYQIILLQRADQKDWEDYQLLITFNEGFYNYGGKYYSEFDKPKFRSSLTIKNRGGVEHCAVGSIKKDTAWATYPADQLQYEHCNNY